MSSRNTINSFEYEKKKKKEAPGECIASVGSLRRLTLTTYTAVGYCSLAEAVASLEPAGGWITLARSARMAGVSFTIWPLAS